MMLRKRSLLSQVSKADYKGCNAASPIAAYTSGNDSITLKRRGHHFFICGVPGHCSAGQKKVDVRIAKLTASSAAPSFSPAASPLPATSSGSNSSSGGAVSNPAAAPRPSGANTATPTVVALALALLYPVFSGGSLR
ncbi:hypothetical protein C4D60_Mb10t01740 [Musa balbisiana]|uniref:Phytocyanin domain-containing protein n=1 Tax=Musa balbisiana TaxID=52838 RepID=A0A4S8IVA6_MUSBA|nr:hypothetical protein C4D60_Mb10t01740 [Musa balbisiana]